MFVVFDLDGTLADIEHRRHFVDGEKKVWDAFFNACNNDEPVWPIIYTLHGLKAQGHRVEIWSGRSESVLKKTKIWLSKHSLAGITLRCRPEGDYRPDVELKKEWLDSCGVKPDLAFDDRVSIVRMWRDAGIICAQVAPGEF